MVNVQNHYTPKLWPGQLLPAPVTVQGPVTELGGGWLRIPWLGDDMEIEVVPDEAHLREVSEVDLTDERAIIATIERIGVPVDVNRPYVGHVDLLEGPEMAALLHANEVARAARRYNITHVNLLEAERPYDAFHVAEAAMMFSHMRTLTVHAVRSIEGLSTADIWSADGFFEPTLLLNGEQTGLQDEPAEVAAWHMFSLLLNNALSPLQPRVYGPPVEAIPDVSNIVPSVTALAVMIYNDLVEWAPVKYCAYEKCGRPFRRQRGDGSGQFSKMTGVMYCSAQHARTQSQLARRRAERASKARGQHV